MVEKVAVVTAGGSGMGAAAARKLAQEGYKVAILSSSGKGEALAKELGGVGVTGSNRSNDDLKRLFDQTLQRWGRIDVLDNNVGIAEMGNVVEVNEASWDHVFAVNLKSAYFAMKHVIPVMQKQGGGSIINISSIASIRHLGISYVTYGASKAAMNQMTKTTAVQFARDHVRVNCILPGLMKTPMVAHSAGLAASYSAGDVEAMWRARDAQVPMGHMGDAWDVANAALFLASDESKYVTGIELIVDGGITVKSGA